MKLAQSARLILLCTLTMLFWLPSNVLGDKKVSLAWEANSETNVAGYNLYYSTVSGIYTNTVQMTNVVGRTKAAATVSIPDWVEGRTYFFVVRAYVQTTPGGGELESSNSNEAPFPLKSLTVMPAVVDLGLGQTQQFSATATFFDNTTRDVTTEAFWQSSDSGVASPDQAGLATASGLGSNDITASISLTNNTARLEVLPNITTVNLISTAEISLTNDDPSITYATGYIPAWPYPAAIVVPSDITGKVTRLTVTFHELDPIKLYETVFLLIAPSGQKIVLQDHGESLRFFYYTNRVTLTFDDAVAATLGALGDQDLPLGTFKPSAGPRFHEYAYPAPAPQGIYDTGLSTFIGITPTGIWLLYTLEDGFTDEGVVAEGWSLGLTTTLKDAASGIQPESAQPSASAGATSSGSTVKASSVPLALVAKPAAINAVRLLSEGQIELQMHGEPGSTYLLQGTEDFTAWHDLQRGTVSQVLFRYVDTAVPRARYRFYRVVTLNK